MSEMTLARSEVLTEGQLTNYSFFVTGKHVLLFYGKAIRFENNKDPADYDRNDLVTA